MKHLPTGHGFEVEGHLVPGYSMKEVGIALRTIADYLNDLIDKGILPEPKEIEL